MAGRTAGRGRCGRRERPLLERRRVDEQVILNALTGTFDEGFAYPPPIQNVMPVQESAATRLQIL